MEGLGVKVLVTSGGEKTLIFDISQAELQKIWLLRPKGPLKNEEMVLDWVEFALNQSLSRLRGIHRAETELIECDRDPYPGVFDEEDQVM